MKIKSSHKAGFTLVEIMIVVAIIGLLAAMAIPNLMRARSSAQQTACINNLMAVDHGIQQWALESGQGPTATVPADGSTIKPYIGHGAGGSLPWCPVAGADHTFGDSYAVTTVSATPTCRIQGSGVNGQFVHAMPE